MPIELFRTWKLGQAQKNNGVLLLVAPNEHKVRIEVGYGLEGTLTDALSSVIISSAIVPRFKTGDFSGGIDARRRRHHQRAQWRHVGLAAQGRGPQGRPAKRFRQAVSAAVLPVDHLHLLVPDPQCRWRRSFGPRRYAPRQRPGLHSLGRFRLGRFGGGGGGFGGGGFGGGFGGGGGSSGGGGASGGW